jgi:hypothetical protein
VADAAYRYDRRMGAALRQPNNDERNVVRINARAVTVALCGLILGALTACANSDSPDVTASSTGSPSATSSPSAATSPTTPPPTTPAALILKTPKEAAEHLYNAWKAGDKPAALLGASSSAVDSLFSEAWTDKPYFFGGCSTDTECDYNYAAGVIKMTIAGSAATGYKVTAVERGNAG